MGSNKRYGDYDCKVCGKREWDVFFWGYVPDKCRECSHKALMQGAYDVGRKLAEKQEQRIINAILGVNMPRFKVGDEVRVKAGGHSDWMDSVCRKAKYIVSDAGKLQDDVQRWMELNDGGFHWRSDWLEPWNPAEEWNGAAWMAKRKEGYVDCKVCGKREWDSWVDKPDENYRCRQCVHEKRGEVAKPAMIAKRGSSQRDELCESTNEAFKRAEALAGLFPGTEYVVYQEKGSRRVDSHAEKVFEFMKARNGKSLAQLYIFFPANELVQESVERDGDYLNIRCKIKS